MRPGFLKQLVGRSAIACVLLLIFFASFFTSPLILFGFFLLAYDLLLCELINIAGGLWSQAKLLKTCFRFVTTISLFLYFSLTNNYLSSLIWVPILDHAVNMSLVIDIITLHLAFFWCIFIASFLFSRKKNGNKQKPSAKKWFLRWFLLIYIAFLVAASMIHDESTRLYLLKILSYVWIFDTFSYLGGNVLGGPLLFPKTSPKKTIAGALCGLLTTLIVSSIFYKFQDFFVFYSSDSLSIEMIVVTLACCAALWGDWYASKLKRTFNVKDSGNLLQEHGGVLDRLDSSVGVLSLLGLLYILVCVYFFIVFLFGLSI